MSGEYAMRKLAREALGSRHDVEQLIAPSTERPALMGSRPTYVNSKQYLRIVKRREARAKLESLWKIGERKTYLHESRHKHACRRKRGPGGRFLTKAELAALKDQESDSEAQPVGRPPSASEDLVATTILAIGQAAANANASS